MTEAQMKARIRSLEAALEEAIEFIENEADMVEGPDGDEPNEALSKASALQAVLDGWAC
jgi:hypothetical protein